MIVKTVIMVQQTILMPSQGNVLNVKQQTSCETKISCCVVCFGVVGDRVKFETLTGYCDEEFRRVTGVKRATFEKMLEMLRCVFVFKPAQGVVIKLSLEEQLLATLEYIREYRTYVHIAMSYQIDESNMYHMIRQAEDALVKDEPFLYLDVRCC